MLTVPCFKETMMQSIGGTAFAGVAYNFTTSRNPGKVMLVVGPITYFGSW